LIYATIVVAWASFVCLAWRLMKAPAFVPVELAPETADDAR
jgi:hypothetical protein